MGRAMQRSVLYQASAMLGLGQWVEQCNLTMLGVQVLSNIYTGIYIYVYIYLFISLVCIFTLLLIACIQAE